MILRNFLCTLSAFVLSIALLTLPANFSSFHFTSNTSSLEADRHADLEQVEDAEHGHAHDDGEPYERTTGHSHGHDPADHSHQVAFVSHHPIDALSKLEIISFFDIADLVTLELGSGFERPPKLGAWT